MLTFDFESEGIEGNPIYNPPVPVGVSIKFNDEGSRYYAWGHPTNNNCTWAEGKMALDNALRKEKEWLAHNAAFENAITRKYWGIKKGNPLNFHDTQYLLFLSDPYAASFSLKPSAERVLGIAPEEQDELRRWILAHVHEATAKNWGAYICRAPGDLVGKYAGNSAETGVPGDTDRTWLLYQKLRPEVEEAGMWEAYQREQRLMPVLFESSKRGVRVDMERLERDQHIFTQAQEIADEYLLSTIGVSGTCKDAELADALERSGQISEWVLTPTGKRSVARKNLVGRIRDAGVLENLAYRGVLETCLSTFVGPWLSQGNSEGNRVHPSWNQVRGDRGQDGDISGTRTGRMSCARPNLQNPPNDFEELVIPEAVRKYLAKARKTYKDDSIPDVLHMRQYLLPEEGHLWLKRDFSAQEMRIMAHFAEGKLYEAYKKDPSIDPHEMVRELILQFAGMNLKRKHVKITGFGIMYGRGVDNLSEALGVDKQTGQATRNAYYAALPEVRWLANETRQCGRSGTPIITWGGRRYYREPNPDRDLSYKLLNYLIQGSAADQTKQSLIDWYDQKREDDVLLAAVHDEINISAPIGSWEKSMTVLREQMNLPRFDVPFLSEGFVGSNWSNIKECA
jgi:DNA polymerase I-like protein with 3'-5' exonuclease and polymerase domains